MFIICKCKNNRYNIYYKVNSIFNSVVQFQRQDSLRFAVKTVNSNTCVLGNLTSEETTKETFEANLRQWVAVAFSMRSAWASFETMLHKRWTAGYRWRTSTSCFLITMMVFLVFQRSGVLRNVCRRPTEQRAPPEAVYGFFTVAPCVPFFLSSSLLNRPVAIERFFSVTLCRGDRSPRF